MKLKVLLVEDDHIQRANVRQAIENALDAEVATISTESEFHRDFERIAANPPQIAVVDVMLRWANPASDMPLAPAEVSSNPEQAGLRCASLLRNDERTNGVEVILYSVLPNDSFGAPVPEGTECLVKELDYQNLIDAMKKKLAG
jgi:PleD family two-component response regulator